MESVQDIVNDGDVPGDVHAVIRLLHWHLVPDFQYINDGPVDLEYQVRKAKGCLFDIARNCLQHLAQVIFTVRPSCSKALVIDAKPASPASNLTHLAGLQRPHLNAVVLLILGEHDPTDR